MFLFQIFEALNQKLGILDQKKWSSVGFDVMERRKLQ